MRTMTKASLAVAGAVTAGLAFASWNAGALTGATPGGARVAAGTVSTAEASGLAFSREEERMARDLYALYADKYGVAMFSRISASEQRHFDAVGVLISRYAVTDPSVGARAGVYADPAIQKLYEGWKKSGLTSVTAAYRTAIALEKRDIADLNRLQAASSNADLDRVYANLERGSDHHLAAFTAAANGSAAAGQMGAGNGAMDGGRAHSHAGNGAGRHAAGCMS